MSEGRKTRPAGGARAAAAQAERAAREAAALRENLRRRKVQARAQAEDTPPVEDHAPNGAVRPDEIG